MHPDVSRFAPHVVPQRWGVRELRYLGPFFSNVNDSVYVPLIPFPELIGALCSLTSRASDDLRTLFLRKFLDEFRTPLREQFESDAAWDEARAYSKTLRSFVSFLNRHGWEELFANRRAREFYLKWLAQYGDDSIAQMTGTHLVFAGLSQLAIKHWEDQRVGLAPIEKSTRFVDYSTRVGERYLYYTDPTLEELGLREEYEIAMDGLFATYSVLIPRMKVWLADRFPSEKPGVIEKKAFDLLRGLLPASTLSQVAFYGNGQAFEYAVNRSLAHPLGEVRWAGNRAHEELNRVIPSLLRRVGTDKAAGYQETLGQRRTRMAPFVEEFLRDETVIHAPSDRWSVSLVEYDPDGESKVITGMLYDAPGNHCTWEHTLTAVRRMSQENRARIVAEYLAGHDERWQKVGRALENTFLRFEIEMDFGAWRDLHRHRMHTQQRQLLCCHHGYDLPMEVIEAGMEQEYRTAIERAERVFAKIEVRDPLLAQYATTMAHRVRFQQWQNLRAFAWEGELRTIPEGHPNYRSPEQEKYRLVEGVFPTIAKHILVNMANYDFARRGQEERIQRKEHELSTT